MSTDDTCAVVLQLAAAIEDRSPLEQRAMLDLALHLDARRARHTVTNPNRVEPFLFELVCDSYRPEGKRVEPTKVQREKYARLVKGAENG